jgi:hypothetical protein
VKLTISGDWKVVLLLGGLNLFELPLNELFQLGQLHKIVASGGLVRMVVLKQQLLKFSWNGGVAKMSTHCLTKLT